MTPPRVRFFIFSESAIFTMNQIQFLLIQYWNKRHGSGGNIFGDDEITNINNFRLLRGGLGDLPRPKVVPPRYNKGNWHLPWLINTQSMSCCVYKRKS